MSFTETSLHLGLGLLGGGAGLLLYGWIARLAEQARVPEHPRAGRWLARAAMLLSGLLLGWGGAGGRPWAVELSGVLMALALWLHWRRRAYRKAAGSPTPAGV